MARPFLERDVPVFVDKPLTLDVAVLREFRPYLERGLLMSCSGMRYARELDVPRATLDDYGALRLVRGAIVLSLDKYGIHLIDAVLNLVRSRPVSVQAHGAGHQSVAIELSDGCVFLLDALGVAPKTFRIDIFGERLTSSHDVTDNFTMFRRTLWDFGRMVQTGVPAIPPEHTIDAMRLLIACTRACAERRRICVGEIAV
jgi:predicted dehydrogenase